MRSLERVENRVNLARTRTQRRGLMTFPALVASMTLMLIATGGPADCSMQGALGQDTPHDVTLVHEGDAPADTDPQVSPIDPKQDVSGAGNADKNNSQGATDEGDNDTGGGSSDGQDSEGNSTGDDNDDGGATDGGDEGGDGEGGEGDEDDGASSLLPPPIATFTFAPTAPVILSPVIFTPNAPANTILTYAWTINGTSYGTARTLSRTFTAPGTYTVRLTVRGAAGVTSGATVTATSSVVVGRPPAPPATFTYTPNPIVVGTPAVFTPDAPIGDVTNYTWSVAGSVVGSGRTLTRTFAAAGNYTVSLLEVGPFGQQTYSATVAVGNPAPPPPVATFTWTPNPATAGTVITFTPDAPAEDVSTYAWAVGGVAAGSGRTMTRTFSTVGTYSVRLIVTGPGGTSTLTTNVGVIAAPPAPPDSTFTYSPNPAVAYTNVVFTPNIPASSTLTYAWSLAGSPAGSTRTLTNSFNVPGTYPVSLTVTRSGVSATSTLNVVVNAAPEPPTATFTYSPSPALVNTAITFTPDIAASEASSYSWRVNGSYITNARTMTRTFSSAATYTIALTVVGTNGLSAASSQSVVVSSTPPVAPDATFTYSPNPAVAFTNVVFTPNIPASTGLTYAWTLSGSPAGSTRTLTNNFNVPGTYPVSLTVTRSGVSATSTVNVLVNAAPVPPAASFTYAPDPAVVGTPITFTPDAPASEISSYSWRVNGSYVTNTRTLTRTFASAGTYTVSLTVVGTNGLSASDSDSVVVTAGAPPVATFTYSPNPAMVNTSVTFTPDVPAATGLTYAWRLNGSLMSSSRIYSRTFSPAGSYTVQLTVTSSTNGSASSTQNVIVGELPPPVATFTYLPASPVVNQSVTFTPDVAAASDLSYAWTVNGLAVASSRVYSRSFSSAATYAVGLTVSRSSGGSASSTRNVVVNPAGGGTPTFYVRKMIAPPSAEWPDGQWVDVGGAGQEPIEIGLRARFDACGTAADNRYWDFGDGTFSTNPTACSETHAYIQAGTYTVWLTLYDGSWRMIGSISKTIVVEPNLQLQSQMPVNGHNFEPVGACASGNRIWTVSEASEFGVVSIANIAAPPALQVFPFAMRPGSRSLIAAFGCVYIANMDYGVSIYADSPYDCRMLGSISTSELGGNTADYVAVIGSALYVGSEQSSRIYVYNLSSPMSPSYSTSLSVPGGLASMSHAAGEGYVVVRNWLASSVSIIDASLPLAPIHAATVALPTVAVGATPLQTHGCAAAYSSRLGLIERSNGGDGVPQFLVRGEIPVAADILVSNSNRLYVVQVLAQRMYKYDTTNPSEPYLMQSVGLTAWPRYSFMFDPDGAPGGAASVLAIGTSPVGFQFYLP